MTKEDKMQNNEQKKALQATAERLEVSQKELKTAICKTIAPDIKTESQFLTFIAVANSYKLNPLRGEITAFTSGGGVKIVLSIDGWISIVNKQETFDGVELVENWDEQENLSGTKLGSVTARFYLKDTSHPIVITEYMEECYKGESQYSPWRKWPRRMLRHKAYIQGARIAFGLSGIYDKDEAERIQEADEEPADIDMQEPQPKEPKGGVSSDQESPDSSISEYMKEPKEAEVINDEPDEEQEGSQEDTREPEFEPEPAEISEKEPEATTNTPQEKNPSKKANMSDEDKQDAIYFVKNVISKTPEEVNNKELKEAFKLMLAVLGEETYRACLNVWKKKSATEITNPSLKKVILQIMLAKVGGTNE
ncbi:MAG: recombinase RecT [candidate division WOR-3 bacterium]|nr:recombinase RecT [candidate division WOR-3 bacterium]